MRVLHQVNVLGSTLASTLTAWRGTSVVKEATQPAQSLQLYDIESSPYYRSVRE